MNTELIKAVEKAQNGDAAAFDEIYRLTNKSVYFTSLRIVGDPADAEDIVQDTYINAFKKLSELKDVKAFQKWLKVIAINLSKNHMAKKRPELFESEEQEEQLINAASLESDNPQPEQILDKRETERMIYELIDELSPEQREVVMLFYYNEFSVDCIAEITSVSANTVKSRLSYARKHIKKELESLARKGTKLYGIPAVGALLSALERVAADPEPAPSAAYESLSAGECVATGVTSAKSGAGVKVAVGIAGVAFVGIGIAVGAHFMGGEIPKTDEFYYESEAIPEQIYIDKELPYEFDKVIVAADSEALYKADDGFKLIDLNTGNVVTEDETDRFDDIIYPFDTARNTCLLRDDGVFCTYAAGFDTFYENCIDVCSSRIMMCEMLGEPRYNTPRRYRLLSEENGEELFVFDESVCIGDDNPRYQPFNDTMYAYIGTEAYDWRDGGKFGCEYLIAVNLDGEITVIYDNGLELGIEEYTDSEETVMEKAYPDCQVLSASAYGCYVLIEMFDGDKTKCVLYNVLDESFVESAIPYTDIDYVEHTNGMLSGDSDVLVLYNENKNDNKYTLCDNELNILLDDLFCVQCSNNQYYLLLDFDIDIDGNGDVEAGYYNCLTGAIKYYDDASVFGNSGALVWIGDNQYFINEEFEICSEALPLQFYEMLPDTDFVYLRESNKLYSFMTAM